MRYTYNVAIVGAGPAGLFSAYRLIIENPELKILVVDKGKSITKRTCPMRLKPGSACVNCQPCGIMSGFGGAGTFSDCKLTLSSKGGVGGSLADYVGVDIADNYIAKVDNILAFFDDKETRETVGLTKNKDIELIEHRCSCIKGMSLSYAPTKHYGTDGTYQIMTKLQEFLEEQGVEFRFQTEVVDITKLTDVDYFGLYTTEHLYYAKNVIVAPGRSGNKWLSEIIKTSFNDDIKMSHNKVDVGVRVEVPAESIKFLTDNLYDMKLSYIDPETGDKIRTFCTNPRGYVSEEHYGENAVVNGHSFSDKKSDKTNFALLVTLNDENLDTDYVYSLVELCNHITKGKLLYQNFKDFSPKQNFNFSKENQDLTLTTAVKGDLKLVLPARVTNMIDKFINYLCATFYEGDIKDIVLYGIEAKFYSDKVEMNNKLETNVRGFYCAGDGAGITRGISQSGAMGLIIADNILSEYKQ